LAGGKLLISAIKGGLFTFFVLSLDSAWSTKFIYIHLAPPLDSDWSVLQIIGWKLESLTHTCSWRSFKDIWVMGGCYFLTYLQREHEAPNSYTRVYPKVSGLAALSENCKWYSSLPLGAVASLFCKSVYWVLLP
jgi:hypothetical protein